MTLKPVIGFYMVSSDTRFPDLHAQYPDSFPVTASSQQRQIQRLSFLGRCGLKNRALVPLGPDASFRRYFRLAGSGPALLLMDAPPEFEDVDTFGRVARHLARLGLRVPQILHMDKDLGFIVLDDFGDRTFTRLIDSGCDEAALYAQAIDVLITVHDHPDAIDIDLPDYDRKRLIDEALLLPDWYAPLIRDRTTDADMRHSYYAVWRQILDRLPEPATSLVLRDFHVDNLMRPGSGDETSDCGLLDFQDAVIGPVAYDVVSLLEDARRDVTSGLKEQMRRRYLEARPLLEIENFDLWYKVLGAQRHCKVAGIFLRLLLRDGKPHYLRHIPRVVALLEDGLNDPTMQPLRQWLNDWLPERLNPFPEISVERARSLIDIPE